MAKRWTCDETCARGGGGLCDDSGGGVCGGEGEDRLLPTTLFSHCSSLYITIPPFALSPPDTYSSSSSISCGLFSLSSLTFVFFLLAYFPSIFLSPSHFSLSFFKLPPLHPLSLSLFHDLSPITIPLLLSNYLFLSIPQCLSLYFSPFLFLLCFSLPFLSLCGGGDGCADGVGCSRDGGGGGVVVMTGAPTAALGDADQASLENTSLPAGGQDYSKCAWLRIETRRLKKAHGPHMKTECLAHVSIYPFVFCFIN